MRLFGFFCRRGWFETILIRHVCSGTLLIMFFLLLEFSLWCNFQFYDMLYDDNAYDVLTDLSQYWFVFHFIRNRVITKYIDLPQRIQYCRNIFIKHFRLISKILIENDSFDHGKLKDVWKRYWYVKEVMIYVILRISDCIISPNLLPVCFKTTDI